MRILFKPIMPQALQDRLLRQNGERVSIHGKVICARQADGDNEFLFKLTRGEYPPGTPQIIQGTPYRVQAFEAEFLFPAGWLDYRIISSGPRSSAVMDVKHDNREVAIRVLEEVRNRFKGLGRSMCSVALNHMVTEGVKRLLLHDVQNVDFFNELAITSWSETRGDDGQRSSDTEDENTTVDMVVQIKKRSLPRIQISLRSETVLV